MSLAVSPRPSSPAAFDSREEAFPALEKLSMKSPSDGLGADAQRPPAPAAAPAPAAHVLLPADFKGEGDFDNVAVFESFDDMGLKESLLRGIYSYGFENPSPIQARAIVPSMTGRDMFIQAQAGTGKTGTFAISILQSIDEALNEVQAIVVSPTRELAMQSTSVLSILGDYMRVGVRNFIGGQSVRSDVQALKDGMVQVVCGTPGRIRQLIETGDLSTRSLRVFVLDEADEVLSIGFRDQIYDIFMALPKETQVLLVSATMPPELVSFSERFMRSPIRLFIRKEDVRLSSIQQFYVDCEREDFKAGVILDLFETISVTQSIIFTNTTRVASMLANRLLAEEHSVGLITSELLQQERSEVIRRFRAGQTRVLVATNIIARGIDVQQVGLVINYDMPPDNESYIHRIGRTGRYGRRGVAINLATDRDAPRLRSLEQFFACQIQALPENFSLNKL